MNAADNFAKLLLEALSAFLDMFITLWLPEYLCIWRLTENVYSLLHAFLCLSKLGLI